MGYWGGCEQGACWRLTQRAYTAADTAAVSEAKLSLVIAGMHRHKSAAAVPLFYLSGRLMVDESCIGSGGGVKINITEHAFAVDWDVLGAALLAKRACTGLFHESIAQGFRWLACDVLDSGSDCLAAFCWWL
jgi:hypothetical protein